MVLLPLRAANGVWAPWARRSTSNTAAGLARRGRAGFLAIWRNDDFSLVLRRTAELARRRSPVRGAIAGGARGVVRAPAVDSLPIWRAF
jgi:hypothetical protein